MTAGNAAKRTLLRRHGCTAAFSSRDTCFADGLSVRAGITVVLNSITSPGANLTLIREHVSLCRRLPGTGCHRHLSKLSKCSQQLMSVEGLHEPTDRGSLLQKMCAHHNSTLAGKAEDGMQAAHLSCAGLVAASLACMHAGGKFVELAKRDVWSAARVAQERPDVAYALLAVDFLPAAVLRSSLQAIGAQVKSS